MKTQHTFTCPTHGKVNGTTVNVELEWPGESGQELVDGFIAVHGAERVAALLRSQVTYHPFQSKLKSAFAAEEPSTELAKLKSLAIAGGTFNALEFVPALRGTVRKDDATVKNLRAVFDETDEVKRDSVLERLRVKWSVPNAITLEDFIAAHWARMDAEKERIMKEQADLFA